MVFNEDPPNNEGPLEGMVKFVRYNEVSLY